MRHYITYILACSRYGPVISIFCWKEIILFNVHGYCELNMLWFLQYFICLKYYKMDIFLKSYLPIELNSLHIMFAWPIIIIHFLQINPLISTYMVQCIVSYISKGNIHLGHAQTVNLKSTWIFSNLVMMFLK